MLALLALALFPVSAFAGESGESVYNPELPSVESQAPPKKSLKESPLNQGHSSGNHKEAQGSDIESTETGESTREPGEETGTGSEGEGHKKEGAVGGSGGGNDNPPKNGGEGGNKPPSGGSSETGISEAKNVGGESSTGKNASETSSGSSSPVVPILIAVVVLAAISIGVVLYRQRKSGQGPDGRGSVSSSNAS